MNIREIFNYQTPQQKRYATSFKRSTATMIDIWVVLFLRMIAMQIMATLWLNNAILEFMAEFNQRFGTETVKNTPEHINFVIHHRVFVYGIIFYTIVILIGAIYHALLNSSEWKGTLGKRIMKIIMVKEDESQISFKTGLAHYFLSVLPFAFVIYLVSYQVRHEVNFFKALTASEGNVFFGIIFVIWVQAHLFTKKRTTAYDLICKTVFINGRTASKFPWKKKS